MPTYEYKCKNCEHVFEQFQSMKDAPLRKCPECGKNTLERLIGTGAAILFKGSGFYQTDYRSESYKAAQKAESGTGTKHSKAGESSAGTAKPSDGAAAKAEPATKPAAEAKPRHDKPSGGGGKKRKH
jgi:putative FmdB family regulatory protein